MNSSQEQNRQEALLALEQLSDLVGQRGFHHQQQRFQELLKSLKLAGPELEDVQQQFNEVTGRHNAQLSEQSTQLRQQVEEKIAAARALFTGDIDWEHQQSNGQRAYDLLEEVHQQLETARYQLTREDRDACWDTLKATRKALRDARQQASAQVEEQAQVWYDEALQAVEGLRFREAKDAFQTLQRYVNQLPLRREQRQQWREKFNQLWEQLQAKGREQREAAQQRQADGKRRLEEALSKVEAFISRKEQDVQSAEARMSEAHWHEVDPIEKQLARDKAALIDARRRQTELSAKLDDSRNRKVKGQPAAETAQAEPAAEQQEPVAEQTESVPEQQEATAEG